MNMFCRYSTYIIWNVQTGLTIYTTVKCMHIQSICLLLSNRVPLKFLLCKFKSIVLSQMASFQIHVHVLCINWNCNLCCAYFFLLQVLSIAGSSYKIDNCTNFGYRAFSLSVQRLVKYQVTSLYNMQTSHQCIVHCSSNAFSNILCVRAVLQAQQGTPITSTCLFLASC